MTGQWSEIASDLQRFELFAALKQLLSFPFSIVTLPHPSAHAVGASLVVGCKVGECEGFEEGELLGDDVGFVVGELEGAAVSVIEGEMC